MEVSIALNLITIIMLVIAGVINFIVFYYLTIKINSIMATKAEILEKLGSIETNIADIKTSSESTAESLDNVEKDVAFLKRKIDEIGLQDPDILAAIDRLQSNSADAAASNKTVSEKAQAIAVSTEDEAIEEPTE